MKQSVDIGGKLIEIDVPDDATPEEIDEIVNAESGALNKQPQPQPESPKEPNPFSTAADRIQNRFDAAGKYWVEAPDKASGALQVAGQAAGALGDAAMLPVDIAVSGLKNSDLGRGLEFLGKNVMPYFQDPEWLKKGLSKGVQAGSEYVSKNVSPNTQRNIGAVSNIAINAPLIGLGGAGIKAASQAGAKGIVKAVEGTGKGLQSTGRALLKGEMKIDKPLAKALGPTPDKAKEKIVKTIQDYKLESMTGDYEKMAQKADELYSAKTSQADEAIERFVAENPDKQIDVPDIFSEIEKSIDNGELGVNIGEKKQAKSSLYKIFDEAVNYGYTGEQGAVPLNALVELKRSLNARGDLFKNSPMNIDMDPVNKQIRESMYLKIVDAIDKHVPEAAALNREAKDLRFVRDAAESASSRIASHQKGLMGGISDIAMTTGGALGAITNPDKAIPIIAATGAGMLGKRAVGQGRGAAAFIKAGRGLEIIGNKLGSSSIGVKQPGLPGASSAAAVPSAQNPIIPISSNIRGQERVLNANITADATKSGTPGPLSMLKNQRGEIGSVNPQVKSDNFKKWFGDWEKDPANASKVVDESGKPLVVYHGTDRNFNQFDKDKLGDLTDAESAKKGFFFTNNYKNANIYAGAGAGAADLSGYNSKLNSRKKLLEESRIINKKVGIDPKTISMTNEQLEKSFYPDEVAEIRKVINSKEGQEFIALRKRIADLDKEIESDLNYLAHANNMSLSKGNRDALSPQSADMLMKKGVDLSNQKIGNPNVKPVFLDMKNPLVYDFKGSGYRDVSFSDLIDKAIQNGNDGVVFKNSWDPVLGDQYVVFSPTQIKSATGNSGAFSPTNPDIRGSSALPMLGLTGATGLGALTGLELARRKQSQKQRSK